MSTLIFGHDEQLAKWCARRIPWVGDQGFGPCRAIGVATGDTPQDKLLAVIVYHDYAPKYGVCQLSFATSGPKWATRGNIRALLSVPFEQYKVRKLWAATPSDNARAQKLLGGLHFTREATLRHHYAPRRHAVVYSMMAHEYRAHWECPTNRQVRTITAAAA